MPLEYLPPPSSAARTNLKLIQKHIKQEEWTDVLKVSREVVKEEKGNGMGCYNALVFAGLALTKLERFDEAEKALTQATTLGPCLPLAYQGLQKLYTDREEWNKLATVLESVIERAVESQDAEEVVKGLGKLWEVRSEHGTIAQNITVLNLVIPTSPIYDLLLSLPTPEASSTSYIPFPILPFPPPPAYSPSQPLSLAYPLPTISIPSLSPSNVPSIPHLIHLPDLSFALLVAITLIVEREERASEEKEVGDRRRRLGAGGEKEVRRGVGREFLSRSKLPKYYEAILNHPAAPDDIRRSAESKLFRHWYRLMTCLSRNASEAAKPQKRGKVGLFEEASTQSLPTKEEMRDKVVVLMKGMILLDVEDEAVWVTELEWKDVGSLDELDITFLHKYITHFPESATTSLITGYLRYFDLPLPVSSEEISAATDQKRKLNRRERRKQKAEEWAKSHPEEEMPVEEEEEVDEDGLFELAQAKGIDGQRMMDDSRKDPFSVLMFGLEGHPKSIFGHKAVTQAYIREQDWENVISLAEKGKKLVTNLEIETGLKMSASHAAFDVALGTALVHFYAPKHHDRALALLEGVLISQPLSVPCLIGRGHIRKARQEYALARTDFEQVVALKTDPTSPASLEASEEAGWCLVLAGQLEEGRDRLASIAAVLDGMKDRAADSARVWWRSGQAEWQIGGEHRETAHSHFVTALRRYPTYASAFTSIGIYYLEEASPPDFDRAQRCFQKAFDLDATQGEAAHRLVLGLAEEREWALVDIIAKRVIAGEGGLEGGIVGTGDTSRFLPTNSWAWKAIGGVEMSYKKYMSAAQAYQVALRVDTDDASLWMRLGEAYAKAGRQAASIKVLQHALDLEPGNWVCNYHMGEVQRQLGLYVDAIASYQRILDVHPDEVGASIALAQCSLDLGKSERLGGLSRRSQESILGSIEAVRPILEASKQYRLVGWRIFAEASLELFHSCQEEGDIVYALTVVLPLIDSLAAEDEDNRAVVTGVTSPTALADADPAHESLILAAICAYAYRADLLKYDKKVSEPPLYDLASALHILALHLPNDPQHSDQREACIKAAVLALKRALDSDPSSPSLWNAFGTVASLGSAQLAQHAFIISLELEPRNPVVWTNLAFLSIQLGDLEVADQALSKAQIVSPEHATAWMGKALVALQRGEIKVAENLFEQAATLSGGSELGANLGFADLVYRSVSSRTSADLSGLHRSSFGLTRYCQGNSTDSAAMHLQALIAERLGQLDIAIDSLEIATALLDNEFEASESSDVEKRYAVALVNLGRVRLASEQYDKALEAFGDGLGLAADDPKLVVHCRLGQALAQASLSNVDEALEAFQQALDGCQALEEENVLAVKEEISVLLARTLWSMRDQDAREAAKAHLLESLSSEQQHSAEAVGALGAIGVLTGDAGLLAAVDAEIAEMNVELLSVDDLQGRIASFRASRSIANHDIDDAVQAVATSIHAGPTSSAARARMAQLLISLSRSEEARGIVSSLDATATQSSSSAATMWRTKALAWVEDDKEKAVAMAQRAVKLQPWELDNWRTLLAARVEVNE